LVVVLISLASGKCAVFPFEVRFDFGFVSHGEEEEASADGESSKNPDWGEGEGTVTRGKGRLGNEFDNSSIEISISAS
jgi:hypothetical protein